MTGAAAANALARDADAVIAVGTRLQDFTTGSHSLFAHAPLVAINANAFDASKARATAVTSDAKSGLEALAQALGGWRADAAWTTRAGDEAKGWREAVARVTGARTAPLPSDGEVIGAVQRSAADSPGTDIVVCAAGSLPGELHKLWRTSAPGGYHVEYGYSCMGYEIAGGLGAKLARPDREVVVMVGDGSYLMMNSEIATSVMLGAKLTIVLLDNRGFGCIHRLQQACGGEPFNNLLDDGTYAPAGAPRIDFAAHARVARRRRGAREVDRRARVGAEARARVEAHDAGRDRHRSAALDRRGRLVVGGGRARGVGAAAGARGARALRGCDRTERKR